MKEIGEQLKKARESMGVSIEEVAEDLKLQPNQIEEIEDGETGSFQDIFSVKYFIRDYAKYLGLDKDNLVDDFNEFLFDYTSKLSLEDIKKESKRKKEDENKIRSPYTVERKNERALQIIAYICIFLLLVIICFLLYSIITGDKEEIDDNLVYGGTYEFTE
ncbi:MAG: helix-turn-helix domain-containing protein [Bacilli bacterium]|nr:helix-turn-helix domain-containing protein [Bacilli bacterium]